MEIGLIFSSKDPRQAQARDFIAQFIRDRGVLARVVESEQPVSSPTLIVNGRTLRDQRRKSRSTGNDMYPSTADMARFLERHLWGV